MKQVLAAALVYTQFYQSPLPKKDVSRLLKWDRDSVLRMLITIKLASQHVARNNSHPLINQLARFLPPSNLPLIDTEHPSRLCNKTVVLKIIADILASPTDETEIRGQPPAFYKDILDTILIYNEHQFPDTGIRNKKLTIEDIWNIEMMQELNAENVSAYLRIGGIKQFIYLQFLKEKLASDYTEFEREVLAFTGLSSMSEIALMFMELEVAFQKAIPNLTPLVIITRDDPKYDLLFRLELVVDASVSHSEIQCEQLFTAPFLKLGDDHLYLTGTSDFDLITTKSWDYYLVKNNLFYKYFPSVSSISDLRGIMGKEYIESFLCYRLLKSMETRGVRVLPSNDKTKPDVTIIINERDVFMIEVKSSALNHRITSRKDIEGFRRFIEKNISGTTKGVSQLNRNIEFLASRPLSDYNIRTDVKKLRIHPIIVFTEHSLAKQAVNDYVQTTSPKLAQETIDKFQSVENITLIQLDFFLENILLLKNDRSLLRKLIIEYHGQIRRMKRNYEKGSKHNDFFSAMSSFDTWSVGRYGVYQNSTTGIFGALSKIFYGLDLSDLR